MSQVEVLVIRVGRPFLCRSRIRFLRTRPFVKTVVIGEPAG